MLRAFIGLLLLTMGILFIFLHLYPSNWPLSNSIQDLYGNAGCELTGIAITVLIVDSLYAYRQEQQLKAQLVREMRSPDNGIALRAVEELRAHRWLADGSLKGVQLRRANLIKANLRGAILDGADLVGAVLTQASLRETHLEGANLSGAILTGALLRGTNLYEATMAGADLRNADLAKADLEGANLQGAKYNAFTQWPAGFIPELSGAVLSGSGS